MKAEILVKHGDIDKISKLTGYHRNLVSDYLKGKRYSRRAEIAREIAITQFNGVEMNK